MLVVEEGERETEKRGRVCKHLLALWLMYVEVHVCCSHAYGWRGWRRDECLLALCGRAKAVGAI